MIPIIIVSHKRPNVITKKVFSTAIICIPEAQKKEYEQSNPDMEILCHPNDVIGLSPKRQWVYQKFGDCFQVDDDISYIMRVYLAEYNRIKLKLTPKESYDLIQDTYYFCKDAGFKLFGFNNTNHPKGYSGNEPLYFNKYITGGAFGIMKDSNLYFPNFPYFVGEDYFINGINAYHNRASFIDGRFAFQFNNTEKGQGGCADYRTEERRRETYIYLKKMFGDAIQHKKQTTIKKIVNKFEKTLKIPY
jgi:hypothetical protein